MRASNVAKALTVFSFPPHSFLVSSSSNESSSSLVVYPSNSTDSTPSSLSPSLPPQQSSRASSDSSAQSYTLVLELHGFVALQSSECLGGVSNGLADTSADWNFLGGTSIVMSSSHLLPITYLLEGAVSLDECARIADSFRYNVMGFMWGTPRPVSSKIGDINARGGGSVSNFTEYLRSVHQTDFGCGLFIRPDLNSGANGTLLPSFICSKSDGVCRRADFPRDKLAEPQFAKAVCCQQHLDTFGLSKTYFTVSEYWFVFRRNDSSFESECSTREAAITRPVEFIIVLCHEFVAYMLGVAVSAKVWGREGQVNFAFWYQRFWASLFWGICAQIQMLSLWELKFNAFSHVSHGVPNNLHDRARAWVFGIILTLTCLQLLSSLPMLLLRRCVGVDTVIMSCINPYATFNLFLGIGYCDSTLQMIYDPAYVAMLGHHPLILGFACFVLHFSTYVSMNSVWHKLGGGSNLVCETGNQAYMPVQTELRHLP